MQLNQITKNVIPFECRKIQFRNPMAINQLTIKTDTRMKPVDVVLLPSQPAFTVQSQQWKHWNNVKNLFTFNHKTSKSRH